MTKILRRIGFVKYIGEEQRDLTLVAATHATLFLYMSQYLALAAKLRGQNSRLVRCVCCT